MTMKKKSHSYNRANYLLKRYTPNHITTNECVSKEYKAKVDKRIYQNRQFRQIESILNEINNPNLVRDDVHYICNEIDNLKTLCRRCTIEQIIVTIILYCQRQYNNRLEEERTKIWKKYELSWKLYSRIIARLLSETRKNRNLERNVN